MNASPTRPRWKLLIVLLALPYLLRLAFRFTPLEEAGLGGAASILTIFLVLIMALLWLLLLSGLTWKGRWIGLGVLTVLGAGLALCVRVEGHMGNFFPQLAWVWSPRPADSADDLDLASDTPAVEITTTSPSDFPRFLGLDQSNWVSGSLLAADWHLQKPTELWRSDIGLGWSSFSVAGPYAYTMEQRGEDEMTVCYEARTGQPIWAHRESARFEESMGGVGPRSTPTVHEGMVYALGATGILLCLDAQTGAVQWRRDTLAEAGQSNLKWAKSGSPLIVDDLVVVTLGQAREGTLAAYDRLSGEPRWRDGADRPAYASPILATLADQRQIIAFNAASVSGHAPDTGAILWSHRLEQAPAHNASPVLCGDDRVLVGVGYGRGSRLLKISPAPDGQLSATEIWHSNRMKPKFADMVLRGDHLYGLDEGRLVCLRLEDGQRAWRGTRFQHGQILGVGDKILIQAEDGDIAIAAASPEEETIFNRFSALSSKTWNHPVLAGRLLLVRNDREAIAFEYPGRPSDPAVGEDA